VKVSKSLPVGKKKEKKALSRMEINSASDDSGFIVGAVDSISEVSSLTKAGKKQEKSEKVSNHSKASKSKIPKARTVKRAYSDKTNSKHDKNDLKRRGLRLSKSMPVDKKKPNSKSSVVLWTTMVQDLESDSDSTSSRGSAFILETELDAKSDLSSLSASVDARKTFTSPQKKEIFKHLGEEEKRQRVSSRMKDMSKKPKEVSYRKFENSKFETKTKEWVWNLTGEHRTPSKLEEILM